MLYQYLIDISKYIIAGLFVFLIAFLVLKRRLDFANKIQLLEFKKSMTTQTLPLKLQAYERFILLIDRLNPENMLLRLNNQGISAKEFQALVLIEIRNEFQHNIAQQIYVSSRAWAIVRRVKEDTLNLMNSASRELPDTASGLDLARLVLNHLSKLENSPYEISAKLLKSDLEDLF
ncbi:MAG: hypothetical protein ACOH2A_02070 [Sphingobacteriaceae bacterium]